MQFKKFNYALLLKSILIWVAVSIVAMVIFAVVMYFLESGYNYSPLFATVSIAVGCFFTALFLGSKLGKKGMLIGLSVGGITFIIVTLVSLLVNSGAVGVYTLLRLIILLLASLIGGIIGVNRKDSQKYI